MDHVGESDSLWLDHEPTTEEVINDFRNFDVNSFDELVFCGFGEPTERIDVLLEVAAYFKQTYSKPIRLNTNGLGNLINNRDIAPEFKGLVDTVSISLNTPNAMRYHELVRSRFGEQSFDAMLTFARACTQYVPHVVLTTVDTTLSKEEEKQCQAICDEIGATYRIRPWED
jgi:TatD family-associated radical SAM protein